MHIEATNLYICGDYHGQKEQLKKQLVSIPAGSAVVFLGDYPIHHAGQLATLSILLGDFELQAYLIRGNHDNPQFWRDDREDVNQKFANLTLLADVDSLQWQGLNVLCIGGAISADRLGDRMDQVDCWSTDEQVPMDVAACTQALVDEFGSFDIMLSHTCTHEGEPVCAEKVAFVSRFLPIDEKLENDLKNEALRLSKVFQVSGAPRSIFGHYHYSSDIDAAGANFRALDICEIMNIEA